MKKLISLFAVSLCLFITMNANAVPLTGVLNIPGDYATLALAITDLNTEGVGAGGVTLNLLAGNPETAPVEGFSITTLTGTAASTITITGNANIITAGLQVAGSNIDAVFKIIGGDYITIQDFTMQENPGNIVVTPGGTNTMTEWGVALLRASTTDGAQNNTVQNNTISLNKTYPSSFAIYSNVRHSATVPGTSADITAASGANNSNKAYGNIISNVNLPIVFVGSGAAGFLDVGNDIGGSSLATGNTLTNWGSNTVSPSGNFISVSATMWGIFINQQTEVNVSYNSLTSSTGIIVTTFRGIFNDNSVSSPTGAFTNSITNNTITLSSANTTGTFEGIRSQGITPALSTATINITDNKILNCAISGVASSSSMVCIANSNVPGVLNLNDNIIQGNTSTSTTGGFTGILNSGAVVTTNNINSNQIGNTTGGAITFSAITTGAVTCISNTGGAATCALSISSNNFQGVVYNTPSTGNFQCINTTALVLTEIISTNNFNNLTVNSSASSLGYLIGASNATPTVTINGNFITTQFTNATLTGGANYLAIANAVGVGPTTGSTTISGNTLSNITFKTTTSFGAAIYWSSGSGVGCTHNTTATGNTISSVLNTSVGTATQAANTYGILIGLGNANVISNNNISTLNAAGGSSIGIFGGTVSTNPAGSLTINNNNIQDIKTTSTSLTLGTSAQGIQIQSGPAQNIVFRNKISDINTVGIGTVSGIVVAQATVGSITTIYNNLVSKMYAPASLFFQAVRAINVSNTVANTVNLYYNTVIIDGNCPAQSYCVYMQSVNPTIEIRNNILENNAVSTGGLEQMVYFRTGALTATFTAASNYNLLYAGTPGPQHLIYADGAVGALTNQKQTLTDYKTFVGPVREGYSFTGNPGLLADLSPDPTNANCWLINGNGIALATIGSDYAGNPRSITIAGGGTDIGAYEFTPSVAPPVLSVTPSVAPLAVSNFILGEGMIASIDVTTLGTLSNVDLQYYSGTVPPGLPGSPPVTEGYGNVYWHMVPTGTGFTYNLVIHYSPALLGNTVESAIKVAIESPPDNGEGFYTPYPQGTGTGQSDVDFVNHNITVRNLTEMGRFIITDANDALPVELSSFTSIINGRNVSLNWTTATETNNSGFDVERKSVTDASWSKVGHLNGAGTVTTPKDYSFDDRMVNSGRYNYRLKQIDFNGNFEYFNLSNEIEIGIPTEFDLSQNYPNPFNPSTKINYDLPFDSKVSITLFDMSGREVSTLVNDVKTAGYYTISFNASNLSSGSYFYRISATGNEKNFVDTKKMILVK